ncbi:MAG TPA: response regulator [Acidimicrobiales bacterium]|nr:response regulator [Acidimicrobiales bacterium]
MPAPATILVADDDPVIQKLLQVNFQMEGYEVVLAGDGLEAVEKAGQVSPDLIVLDVMMPRMNGLDAAERLKADPVTASIPIIILSAKAQEIDVKAGRATGADDYMTKPFDPLELLDRAAALMGRT